MTRRILQNAAMIAGVCLVAAASAQNDPKADLRPVNVSVKAGVGLPLSSSLSDISSAWIALGGEFMLPQSFVKDSETYFSLDWFTKDFRGERTNIFPFMINQRFYTSKDLPGRRKYFFVGAGVDFIDIVSSDTVVAARGGLGAELGENIFTEAALYIGDKSTGNISPTMVGIFLGYRF